MGCLQEGAVMPRLFVRHHGNMEVRGCLGGDIKVNVVCVTFVN